MTDEIQDPEAIGRSDLCLCGLVPGLYSCPGGCASCNTAGQPCSQAWLERAWREDGSPWPPQRLDPGSAWTELDVSGRGSDRG